MPSQNSSSISSSIETAPVIDTSASTRDRLTNQAVLTFDRLRKGESLQLLLKDRLRSPTKPLSMTRLWKWFNSKQSEIPLWLIEDLAAAFGFTARLLLVRRHAMGQNNAADPANRLLHSDAAGGNWFPLFLVGLGFSDLNSAPNSIVQLMADLTGAKNAVLYRADPQRNILTCECHHNVVRSAWMEGLSWCNEIPSQILRRKTTQPKLQKHEQVR